VRALPVAAWALLAAGVAAAQAQNAPAPQQTPAAQDPPAAPAPRLKLRLQDPARYAREVPSEERKSTAPLPALGGGPTTFSGGPPGSGGPSPYPQNTDAASGSSPQPR